MAYFRIVSLSLLAACVVSTIYPTLSSAESVNRDADAQTIRSQASDYAKALF